jgi:hypothetical protein
MANEDWVPTGKLRWLPRDGARIHASLPNIVLQAWYSPNVPGYMRRDAEGEWRDVVVEEETAP